MNDIICFEIVDINSSGITLKNVDSYVYVSFDDCAQNFASENLLETSKCIATRDITKLSYTFYTNPKTILVFKKHLIKDLFSGISAQKKFSELRKAITKYGYTSYDMS